MSEKVVLHQKNDQAVRAWFGEGPITKQSRLRLFCFPYAGGNAQIYRTWGTSLPRDVSVVPVELPGRGPRLKEPRYLSVTALVETLTAIMEPVLDKPFAFFGHSMGAIIAFELARAVRRVHGLEPEILFVSGRRAPQIPDTDPLTYDLPYQEFVLELERINGTPKEVLEHAELMQMMLPLLRADFQLVQTYEYLPDERLKCPITAFAGVEDDEETPELLAAWKEQTSSHFAMHRLPGDHFFIRSSKTHLLDALSSALKT